MHQIIRIICYAKDEKEARDNAEDILNERLVGDGKPFDYGTFFDDESAGASGKARWGYHPAVVKADCEEGKKMIQEGLKYTQDGFKEDLKKIREGLKEFSDEEIIEEEVLNPKKKVLMGLARDKGYSDLKILHYYFCCFGGYIGTSIYLYDNDGEGIRTNTHLKNVLSKWGNSEDYKDLDTFVIPIDVHS